MKKKLITMTVVVFLVLALVVGGYFLRIYLSSYLFPVNGKMQTRQDLFEKIKNIENKKEREAFINGILEMKWITQEEADSLY